MGFYHTINGILDFWQYPIDLETQVKVFPIDLWGVPSVASDV
jgi:hypothetical protein